MRKVRENQRGFTFFEIIVGTVVLLIGIASITSLVLWGRLVLKHSENKAQAMSVAYSKLEEYLAKSYSGIGMQPTLGSTNHVTTPLPKGVEGTIFTESGEAASANIFWDTVVKQLYEGEKAKGECPPGFCADPLYDTILIPYKELDIQVKYREESPMQRGAFSDKAVRLLSFVPYPVLHALSPTALHATLSGPRPPSEEVPFSGYSRIGTGLKVDIDYETPQDILIIYNVAIKINDSNGLILPDNGIATMYTGCFVDGAPEPVPVETRTPILSQPLVSNVTALTGAEFLAPGPHTIEVKWYKDVDGGNVSLRNANIIIIAVESRFAHETGS